MVQTARSTQDTRDYYRLSVQLFSFKKLDVQSESNFSMMNEAENDRSSTTSSQPSLVGQAAKLHIDDTRHVHMTKMLMLSLWRSILAATVILMEEHTCCNCTQPHKAGMDLVLPTEQYNAEVAENESLPLDEGDLCAAHWEARPCVATDPRQARIIYPSKGYIYLNYKV